MHWLKILHETPKLICGLGKTIDLLVNKADFALLNVDSKPSNQRILSLEEFPATESSRGERSWLQPLMTHVSTL